MEDSARVPFLMIDDDKNSVMSLKKLVNRAFPNADFYSLTDGVEGWDFIKNFGKPLVVVSDLNMPGINGLQVLKNIRTNPELGGIYFILMTSSVDKELNIKALQQGADDFIQKPFSIDDLLGKLRAAYRIITLQHELTAGKKLYGDLQAQIKEDSNKVSASLIKIQNLRIENAEKLTTRVSDAAVWIAKQLEDVESHDDIVLIENAAKLCLFGRITLNDTLLTRPIMARGMTVNASLEGVPAFANDIISSIRGLEPIAKIIAHIYENFDGSGIPEKIKAAQIPIGSRILRVALDFEEALVQSAQNSYKAMETLYHECQRLYDHRAVAFYDQYLAVKGHVNGVKERSVKLHELTDNTVLTRHIITYSGLVLLTANTVLNSEKISRINDIQKVDPIIGKIYVRMNQ